MLRKSRGGLHKAPTKEERRKRKAKRKERSDQVYLSLDLNDSMLSDSGKQEEGMSAFHAAVM